MLWNVIPYYNLVVVKVAISPEDMAGTSRREEGIMVQSEDDYVLYFYFSQGINSL